jgi:release factor glutamine methyltransferase
VGLRPVRWRELHAAAAGQLGSAVEARWLVEAASGGDYPGVLDELVTERTARWFAARVARRRAGEPLQYVLGRWAFRRLDLLVDRRVLIPRPETEQVVEVALAELRRRDGPGRDPAEVGPGRPVVVDLGTGSGAIALSIAAEHPRAEVWATDASSDALDVARANLAGLGGSAGPRVRLAQGSWWDALPEALRGSVDLVVSNPPYIAAAEMAGLPAEVAEWEPLGALEAGPDGLEAITAVLAGAPGWLASDGAAVIEIAPHQAGPAAAAARLAGFADVEVHPDLAGRDRALVARRPSGEIAGGAVPTST